MQDLGILDHRCCELIQRELWDRVPEGEFHRFVNHRGANYLREMYWLVEVSDTTLAYDLDTKRRQQVLRSNRYIWQANDGVSRLMKWRLFNSKCSQGRNRVSCCFS